MTDEIFDSQDFFDITKNITKTKDLTKTSREICQEEGIRWI